MARRANCPLGIEAHQELERCWLAKLRATSAPPRRVSVLVSQVIPKGVDTFDFVDGRLGNPSAHRASPRSGFATFAHRGCGRPTANQGQQGKMEMVYQYLTGSAFRKGC